MFGESSQIPRGEEERKGSLKQCPYLDTTHSTAKLRYLCKGVIPVAEIEPRESANHKCREDYFTCPRYRERNS